MRSSPSPGAPSRRRALCRLALLLGILCLVSQVSATLHWVLVRHVQCAEHGDWVHAEETEHRASSKSVASEGVSAQPAAHEAHGHEHCSIPLDPRQLAAEPSEAAQHLASFQGEPPVWTASPSEPRSRALHQLAPKTSPPGVGSSS